MKEHVLTLVLAIFASSGFWAFLTAVVQNLIQKPQITVFCKQITGISGRLDALSEKIDRTNADNSRTRILRFDDELYVGQEHTREYFTQMLTEIDTYEDYCQSHPAYANSKAVEAIKHIREIYQYCRDNHKFL